VDKLTSMEQEAEQTGLDSIKYGNPGIRTDVWKKMLGLYGEAVGTFIGLSMDTAVQILNQGFVTPVQKFQKSIQQQDYTSENHTNFNKADESRDCGFKQVKIE